jgi:hypothetical protein
VHEQQRERTTVAPVYQQSCTSLRHAGHSGRFVSSSIGTTRDFRHHLPQQELFSPPPVLATPGAERRATTGIICLEEASMNGIIYIVGLIVVIMFILSFLGLR